VPSDALNGLYHKASDVTNAGGTGSYSPTDLIPVTIGFTILRALLVLAAVRDMFHTLFNPSKQSDLSGWIARGIWRTFKRI
jgi:hypothetical protein